MKQAVVIIHGIGDQKPMDTIRGFVDALIEKNPEAGQPKFYNKPDKISELLELRKYTSTDRDITKTDFYEYYWQHLMKGTKMSHVLSWMHSLLFTSPKNVTAKLKPIWWASWGLIVTLVISLLLGFLPTESISFENKHYNFLFSLGSFILLSIINGVAINYMGDAARYLSPNCEHVEIRQKIRAEGINLLRNLHKSRQYDRIVLVGHSLGSVIAYDIIKHLWIDYNDKHNKPLNTNQDNLNLLERFAHSRKGKTDNSRTGIQRFQSRQRALWLEQRRLGNPWLISDFITLGSPLAHAPFLLAKSQEDLKARQNERELPTCPPVFEGDQFSYKGYTYEKDGQKRSVRVLHHAAVFAPTRWTNLYFSGDFIGGPLRRIFGNGIYDIEVSNRNKWKDCLPTSHTKYWKVPKPAAFLKKGKGYLNILALRNAVGLRSEEWLGKVKNNEPIK